MTKQQFINVTTAAADTDKIVIELPNGDRFLVDFVAVSHRKYPKERTEIVIYALEEDC